MGFLRQKKTTGELEEELESASAELDLAQKKALIREVQRRYGRDWKLHLPRVKSGMDWKALRFKVGG